MGIVKTTLISGLALLLALIASARLFAQDAGGGEALGIAQAQMISKAFRETARSVVPSVVKIVVKSGQGKSSSKTGPLLPFGELLSETERDGHEIEGIGSGVLVDPSGIILTNYHVVTDSENIWVELYDGRQFRARDIKKDEQADLAVLMLDCDEPLPALPFADSDTLEIGDWVLAVGNPFMLDSSVSAGIVSAIGRSLHNKESGIFIQTDAAINPGNSGGPLVNLRGEIVGINTAIASMTGGYQGIGFAIPSNTARWIMRQLIERGKVQRAFHGVDVEPLTYTEAQRHGLGPRSGVKTRVPFRDSPAARAGVRSGDIILAFDGRTVDSMETLQALVELADLDADHRLTILRRGEEQSRDLPIKVEIRPDNYVGVPQTEKLVQRGKHYRDANLGLMLIPLTADSASRLQIEVDSGWVVLSVTPGTIAWDAGLRDGMCIVGSDGEPIPDIETFHRLTSEEALERGVDLDVLVKGESRTVTLKKKG